MSQPAPLEIFVRCFQNVPDPRSKHGVSHPFRSILAVVLLGLLANVSTPTEIARWAKLHFTQLKLFIRFKNTGTPGRATISRTLRKLSLDDLQAAFAPFLNDILDEQPIAAAVDGKAAKQMKDENGDPILMLNVFAQNLKLHLARWSVRGDKTNEPGCLKPHREELFAMYPCLKLLTGDAMYAQRPLLEAIQEHNRDYLVQIKDNQEKTLEQMKLVFGDAPNEEPSDRKVGKKRARCRYAACG